MTKCFAIVAIMMIAACSLVIDPDKLVEGNGTDVGDGDAESSENDGGDR